MIPQQQRSIVEMRDYPRERQRRKYANVPTVVDGVVFDSRAEANRWVELQALQAAGKIRDLRRQVRYVLVPATPRPSGGAEREKVYVADFVHVDARTGRTVVTDVKGAEPAVWALKRALMLHVHGIEIVVAKG